MVQQWEERGQTVSLRLARNMTQDEVFMREAIKEAEIAVKEGNWPFGCVIVVNGEIVARAHNTGYTDHNRMAHAELKALYQAKDILEKNRGNSTLYTTFEPCPMCFGACLVMKIRRVVAGINLDESGGFTLKNSLPKYFQQEKFAIDTEIGVLADECKAVYLTGEPVKKHIAQGHVKII